MFVLLLFSAITTVFESFHNYVSGDRQTDRQSQTDGQNNRQKTRDFDFVGTKRERGGGEARGERGRETQWKLPSEQRERGMKISGGRERRRDRERERETDGQTDGQTDGRTDRQTDRQTDRDIHFTGMKRGG